MEDDQVFSAINTLVAPRWKILLAKIFGQRAVTIEEGYKIVLYKWRGVIYMTSFKKI